MAMEKGRQSNVYLLLLSAQVLLETGSLMLKNDNWNISSNFHLHFYVML